MANKRQDRTWGGGIRHSLPAGESFPESVAPIPHDSQVFNGADAAEFFDPDAVRWYRRMIDDSAAEQAASDLDFLREREFVVSRDGRLHPTRAAILVFGRLRYVRQILPRPVVDIQFIGTSFAAWPPDQRWFDRFVAEENLIQTWLMLVERYMRHADHPFRLDPSTFRRDDQPPDHMAFREAALNLLLHQDYENHSLKASIRVFYDRIVFSNPGTSLVAAEGFPGSMESRERNPTLAEAFRRIGLGGRTGSGMCRIFDNWRQLGYVSPVISSNQARGTFELCLLREEPKDFGDHHRHLLDLCAAPKSLLELMESVGVKHRTFFRRRHLKPLLDAGLVRMTNPDRPRAANQRYILTAAGRHFRAHGEEGWRNSREE